METNGNAPVTRADLEEFKATLVKQIGELIDTRIRQSEEQFAKRLHDAETRLLRTFDQSREHLDVRISKMSTDISNMDTASDLRLNNLERRVMEIDRRFLESAHQNTTRNAN